MAKNYSTDMMFACFSTGSVIPSSVAISPPLIPATYYPGALLVGANGGVTQPSAPKAPPLAPFVAMPAGKPQPRKLDIDP